SHVGRAKPVRIRWRGRALPESASRADRRSSWNEFAGHARVSLDFEFGREGVIAAADDLTIGQYMHPIRFHEFEQPWVMGDEQHRAVRISECLDSGGDAAQCVDVAA